MKTILRDCPFCVRDCPFCGGGDIFDEVAAAKAKLLFDLIMKADAFKKLAGDDHNE